MQFIGRGVFVIVMACFIVDIQGALLSQSDSSEKDISYKKAIVEGNINVLRENLFSGEWSSDFFPSRSIRKTPLEYAVAAKNHHAVQVLLNGFEKTIPRPMCRNCFYQAMHALDFDTAKELLIGYQVSEVDIQDCIEEYMVNNDQADKIIKQLSFLIQSLPKKRCLLSSTSLCLAIKAQWSDAITVFFQDPEKIASINSFEVEQALIDVAQGIQKIESFKVSEQIYGKLFSEKILNESSYLQFLAYYLSMSMSGYNPTLLTFNPKLADFIGEATKEKNFLLRDALKDDYEFIQDQDSWQAVTAKDCF